MPSSARRRPDIPEQRVASALREAREQKGIGQRELAEAVGISQPQLSKMERGEKPITLSEAARLAEALGLRLSELVATVGL